MLRCILAPVRMAALLAGLALSGGPALAQVAVFQPNDYGKADLPLRESLGDAVTSVMDKGNVFEPISRLAERDPIRTLSRAIGRLDVLYENGEREIMSTCTAALVGADLLMTNYHCIPGMSGKVGRASILLDYLEKGEDEKTERIDVEPVPLAADLDLDYALVRLRGPIPEGVEPLHFRLAEVGPLDRLLIIHHPAGQPKMMTQFQCFAHSSLPATSTYIRHVCDTLPGSSGGILFNAAMQPVGLHHTGGLNANDPKSFNMATAFADIIAKNPDLLAFDPDSGPVAAESGAVVASPRAPAAADADLNSMIGK